MHLKSYLIKPENSKANTFHFHENLARHFSQCDSPLATASVELLLHPLCGVQWICPIVSRMAWIYWFDKKICLFFSITIIKKNNEKLAFSLCLSITHNCRIFKIKIKGDFARLNFFLFKSLSSRLELRKNQSVQQHDRITKSFAFHIPAVIERALVRKRCLLP